MRIAVIAPPWAPIPPNLYGGIEAVLDRLCVGLQRNGHEVMLFTTAESTCPVPRQHILERAEGSQIGATVPELSHVIAGYEAARGFDIIHDHTNLGPFYAERQPRSVVASTIHGPLDATFGPIYARMADRVSLIAISHAQRHSAPEIPVAAVIHHGIDADQFPVGDGSGGYAVFLGRMSPDKGAHRAVAAAKKAGVPLRMAAKMRSADEVSYFENVIEPALTPDTEYLGEVSHEDKLALLAGARALLFPIRWNEPFGMVMIEALACGTPVLAFPEGSAPEVVHHNRTGFLCEDEAGMADALQRVDTIDRRDCRAAVEGHFSTDRMVAEHLQLFEDLLSR
jgi:glycosyltransferase involved in cell wall biosynthesis